MEFLKKIVSYMQCRDIDKDSLARVIALIAQKKKLFILCDVGGKYSEAGKELIKFVIKIQEEVFSYS